MIVSSDFSNMNSTALRKISAEVRWYGANPTTFSPDDYLQEIKVTRVGEHGKFFGFGVCQQATVKIIDEAGTFNITKGQMITLSFNGNSEVSSHYRYHPSMIIRDVTRDEKTRVVTFKAYDFIDNATAYTFKDLNLEAPYKISDIVYAICDKLDISCDTLGSGFDTVYEKGANFSGDENLRIVLNAIAEATQTIYYVDYLNFLVFKTLSIAGDPVLTIDKNNYFELTTGTAATLTKLMHVTELGENVYVGTDAGECQYIRDNPFWNNRTDIDILLAESINRVSGLTIVPYNIRWRGNFLAELGDKVSIETKDGTFINTFILDDSLTFNGGMTQTMSWEYSPDSNKTTAANPATIGEKLNQTFARVDKIEKNITLYVSEIVDEVLPTKIEESLDEFTDEINQSVAGALEPLGKDITDLKATTLAHTENISSLTLTTQAINSDVNSLKETTTTITDDLGEVVATQTTIQEDIGNLQVKSNQISASITSVEKTITDLGDEVDGVSDQANNRIDTLSSQVALKLDKQGVEITVDKKLEEGVNKVVTSSKKYSFDDEGLNISAPDSEFSTEVTDNGMRIYKHSSEILTVNNQGVQAADLHARTFLIIGENSRLEDRGNRTACFWIGPAGG